VTDATWPVGDIRLERRYRRLLLAYPHRFRQVHGAEIVTTLVEMAEPGQTRPAVRDAWHLCVSGVRQRFRLPASRPLARVGAVLVALILGAFGAAVGSQSAQQTFPALPDDARVAALTAQAAPGGKNFALGRSGSRWEGTAPTVFGAVDAPGWTPDPSRDRLAADGWRVTPIRAVPGASSSVNGVRLPQRGHAFDATRDGLHMRIIGYESPGPATVSVNLSPANTAVMVPAVIAGGLLGALAGWLIAAAGAYRIRRLTMSRRRVAVVLSGLAMTALVVPASALSIQAVRAVNLSGSVVRTLHDAVNASPYWSFVTPWTLLQLTVTGLGLSIAAGVAMSHREANEAAPDQNPAVG
jgi:hypothetical protein